jgi:hypothetical protein
MARDYTKLSLAPSAAKTWLSCTAQPAYIVANADRCPPETDTPFSKEGTEAHSHAATALICGYMEEAIPELFRESVRQWVDLIEGQITGEGQLLVERKVPLFYMPERNGTVDAAVLTDECLFVNDFKFGQGVTIEAKENPQVTIYAESLIRSMGLREKGVPEQFAVEVNILQPRTRDGEPLKTWRTTIGEIGLLASQIGAVARSIISGNPEVVSFAPSKDTCQFCPAKGFCEARAEARTRPLVEAGARGSNPFDLVKTACQLPKEALSPEVLQALAVEHLEGNLVKWLEDVAQYVQSQVAAGSPDYPALKLVQSKKHRVWQDEAEVEALLQPILKDKLYTMKLITPSQAEKLLKGSSELEKVAELAVTPPGEPVLALLSDKRPAMSPPALSDIFGAPLEEGHPLI